MSKPRRPASSTESEKHKSARARPVKSTNNSEHEEDFKKAEGSDFVKSRTRRDSPKQKKDWMDNDDSRSMLSETGNKDAICFPEIGTTGPDRDMV